MRILAGVPRDGTSIQYMYMLPYTFVHADCVRCLVRAVKSEQWTYCDLWLWRTKITV